MKIIIIGGGLAGLYFASAMKLLNPDGMYLRRGV
jgi:protoporphyrinogen oxidase